MKNNKENFELPHLTNKDRLSAYQSIINGCSHLWSKGKLQKEKLPSILNTFATLKEEDPFFLAHFTSYAIKNLDSKDLKVVSVFMNSLNDADGTPFIIGNDDAGRPIYSEKFRKPNLRIVSQAGLQELDPKLVSRVVELANIKQQLGKAHREGTHFSTSLKTAIRKWIKFRENNPKAMEGIKKAGLSKTVQKIYRMIHMKPNKETSEILGWRQGSKVKNNIEKISKRKLFNFKDLSDLEIAKKIRNDKLSPLGVLGALPDKISPVIAAAILEQANGNQAVILRGLFDKQGLLKDKEVLAVFNNKIQEAKTALDRVDKINTEVDRDVSQVLKTARSNRRKKDVGSIGKVFIHLDISGSMGSAIKFAMERGSIIAECITDPENNFHWGAFRDRAIALKRPESFEKDAFMAALYGVTANGGTDCLANYKKARELGCDIDVYITDQDHNGNPVENRIKNLDSRGYARPKAVVIVDFSNGRYNDKFKDVLEGLGIPVAILKPNTLVESALITEAVKSALLGATAVIDSIMDTPLLKLPEWWTSV